MSNDFRQYQKASNIIYELIASIVLGFAIGYFVDKYFYKKPHLWVAIVPLFFILSMFVRLYMQTIKSNKQK